MEFLSEEDDQAHTPENDEKNFDDSNEDEDYEKISQPSMSSEWVVPQTVNDAATDGKEEKVPNGSDITGINPFTSIEWETKSEELVSIQAFETVRRRSFGKEMLQCWTHWAALDSMLERTVGEVVTARRLVQKKIEVEESYAAGLVQVKLVASEAKRDFPRLSDVATGSMQEATAAQTTSTEPFPSEVAWAACGIQASAATEQAQAVRELKEGCLGSLNALEARAMSTSRDLRREGESALALASAAARGVEKLFDAFVACAAAIHADARSLDPSLDRSHADLWLADAQYRLAADGLQAAWRRSSSRLAILFKEARLLEIDRRAFLSKAYNLTVASTAATRGGKANWIPYKAWSLRDQEVSNPELLAKHVDAIIKAKADALAADRRRAFLKRWQQHHHNEDEDSGGSRADSSASSSTEEITTNSTNGEEERSVPEYKNVASKAEEAQDKKETEQQLDLSLAMPLASPLVVRAAILERRREGVAVINPNKRWRRCVIIITADRFLHAFDCDEAAQDTDAAFDLLAAQAIDSFLEAALAHHAKPTPLKPALSIDLSASNIQDEEALGAGQNATGISRNKSNINQLHITETVMNIGARKLLGKNQIRHAIFRIPPEHGPRALTDLHRLLHLARVID